MKFRTVTFLNCKEVKFVCICDVVEHFFSRVEFYFAMTATFAFTGSRWQGKQHK